MDDDFLLLHRMQNGDEQAIESFVRKHYRKILRYCHLHIKDSGFADDITQETFARFFRTLHQYRHYGKAANYLYVIAGNLCRDYYRKSEELPMEELSEHPVCLMESLDLRVDVHMALERLPRELREVTILYFFQEVRQKEIAKLNDVVVGAEGRDMTVKYRPYYIEIPLHVGYRYNVLENLGVYADFGPYFAIGVNGKEKFDFTDMHFDLGPAEKIFGPGGIRVKTQGSAELKFGINKKNIDNPSLPIRNRKTTMMNFDEKINLNVNGKVGDKMNLNLNYNTDATFDYDAQNMKPTRMLSRNQTSSRLTSLKSTLNQWKRTLHGFLRPRSQLNRKLNSVNTRTSKLPHSQRK